MRGGMLFLALDFGTRLRRRRRAPPTSRRRTARRRCSLPPTSCNTTRSSASPSPRAMSSSTRARDPARRHGHLQPAHRYGDRLGPCRAARADRRRRLRRFPRAARPDARRLHQGHPPAAVRQFAARRQHGAARRRHRAPTIRRAVYSPCELCQQDPSRPPVWQIKAEEVVHDKELRDRRVPRCGDGDRRHPGALRALFLASRSVGEAGERIPAAHVRRRQHARLSHDNPVLLGGPARSRT